MECLMDNLSPLGAILGGAEDIVVDDTNLTFTADNVQESIEALNDSDNIEYATGVSVKSKLNSIKYTTLGSVTPTTNEKWSSVIGKLRDNYFSTLLAKTNYVRLITNMDGQQGTIFQPFRVYSSATTTHWGSVRASDSALTVYVISTTSSSAKARKFEITSSGLTITDLSNENATEVRISGLDV